ncbi:MAG: DNA cytosine methyltransferase, partial [Planktomarina sp.]
MKSIELFAGAGGLGMGAELAGFSNVLAVEWDKWAVETLQYNRKLQFPLVNDWDIQKSDVRAIDFANYADKVELVTGGPPCQPFSMAGKHKAFDDKRDMFGAFADVLAAVAPKAFVAENVKGLTRAAFSNYLEYIKLRLRFPLLKLTVG